MLCQQQQNLGKMFFKTTLHFVTITCSNKSIISDLVISAESTDFFNTLINDNICELMVKQTNIYAQALTETKDSNIRKPEIRSIQV